eukprot:Hpha_TRINITY_DN30363_c0_g1::TRINITY_DN30363_c0_g1_i1::g.146901::m.146901
MVQMTPIMRRVGWKYNSGYHREGVGGQSPLLGFGHTALSGTGLNDGGDFALAPGVAGTCDLLHDAGERAEPGFYTASVVCGDHKVVVSGAATERGGMWRFPGLSIVRLDLSSPLDRLGGGTVEKEGAYSVSSFRRSYPTHHCATQHTAYFWIEANAPVAEVRPSSFFDPGALRNRVSSFEIVFNTTGAEEDLLLRVGLSHTDKEGAKRNLARDLHAFGWDFDAVRSAGRKRWNEALSRVAAKAEETIMQRFYTALYHAMLGPTLFSDADGRYSLRPGKVSVSETPMYSTFSLWDTYRAEHPLLALLFPQMVGDLVQSLLQLAESPSTRRLPRWVLFGHETQCMSGYPAAVVIADSIRQGHVEGKLAEDAFEASVRTADLEPHVKDGRPIPSQEHASVSRALEAATADACIARAAQHLSHPSEASRFQKRGNAWTSYFHVKSGLLLPRNGENFKFPDPDTPGGGYEEGTPRQYSFMVPHDAAGLDRHLRAAGKSLEKSLDTYFYSIKFRPLGPGNQDVETGIFGGHTHGNEPGHHTPYLYNAAGVPWKTQKIVDILQEQMYPSGGEGLPGNDDVGQTSAWYVWSALGLYPVDPCGDSFEVGRPLVRSAVISPGGKPALRVEVEGQQASHRFVKELWLDGRQLKTTSVERAVISRAGEKELKFVMTDEPFDFRYGMKVELKEYVETTPSPPS